MNIGGRTTVLVSRVAAVFLVYAGARYTNWFIDIEALFRIPWIPPPRNMFSLAAIAAGMGIWLGRSWGFYLSYVVIIFSVLSWRTTMPFVPATGFVARELGLIGIAERTTVIALNLILAATIGGLQLNSRKLHLLDVQPSLAIQRRRTVGLIVFSSIVMLAPILGFVGALVVDPPGPGMPAAHGGGMLAFYTVILAGPYVPIGLIGLVFFCRRLRRLNAQVHGKANVT